MDSELYDFIIVGGGTAGLVLAARLSEDPTQQILVLEAGSDHSEDPRVKIPAFYSALLASEVDWDFKSELQPGLNGRQMNLNQVNSKASSFLFLAASFSEGKALGGTSILNAHVFAPPTKQLIDNWASLGNEGWDWEGLGDYYAKAFTFPPVASELEKPLGIDGWPAKVELGKGPIQVSFPGNPNHPIREAWVKTFKNLGYPMPNDPWVDPSVAVGGFSNLTTIDPVLKERNHSARTYYYPVKNRENLRVLSNALVEKVLFESPTKAVGVQYHHDAERKIASARNEVIISAGALQSPKLLELSGIGNADLLKQHNIKVISSLEGVGENLQDHLVCSLVFKVADGVETLDAISDPEMLGKAMQEFTTQHTGLLSSGGIKTYSYMPVMKYQSDEGRRFLKQLLDRNRHTSKEISSQAKARASAYYEIVEKTLLNPAAPTGAYLTAIGQDLTSPDPATGKPSVPSPGGCISLAGILTQPLSRGSVHIKSDNPSEAPIADPQYFTNEVDVEVFAEHVAYLHTVAATPPFSELLQQPAKLTTPSAVFADTEAAKEFIRRRVISMWHFAGTCAMLPKEKGGVVDTNLKVYGVENLRVVDSSIVPLLPPGNLQSTVYAVAEKAADLIKAEYGLKTTD
ncbi:putative GMC oxidoreductase [Hypoxylon sp. CI-4A]|nr:putative GMC oxidoreductase [Hypoxylon sp. CI-4A]